MTTDTMRCMQEAIERLRSWAQNQEMIDASYTEHGRDCQLVADDVERLQEELGAFQRRFVAVGEVLKARTRESEIEELRAERAELAERITDMLMPEIERLREGERAADAEIERLRSGVRCPHCDELRLELGQARKDLAQEKEEHDRCTTFHAIAVKERNYERVLALKRDAEIERLRGENSDLNAGWQRTYDHDCNLMKSEIERLRALYIETAARHEGELIRRDEKIRRLRIANGQWERACNGYKEVIAEQDKIINNREDK